MLHTFGQIGLKVELWQAARLMAKVKEWHRTHPVLSAKKRKVLVKLHDKYNEELKAKEQEKTAEIRPTADQMKFVGTEYEALIREGQSLGSRHDRELKEINEKYMLKEFEYCKPFIKKLPQSKLRPSRVLDVLKNFYLENRGFAIDHKTQLEALRTECENEYAETQSRHDGELHPLLEKQGEMYKKFEDLKAQAKVVADKYTRESDRITYKYMKTEWDVMNDKYTGGNGLTE